MTAKKDAVDSKNLWWILCASSSVPASCFPQRWLQPILHNGSLIFLGAGFKNPPSNHVVEWGFRNRKVHWMAQPGNYDLRSSSESSLILLDVGEKNIPGIGGLEKGEW